jgi:hypothetical protein
MSNNASLITEGINSPSGYAELSGGDIISISNVTEQYDYKISLFYSPTGGLMGTKSWKQ